MQHDFEDIEVKANAFELLEDALRRKRRKCMIGTGSMCDPYMHVEKELKLTQRCLELIDSYGFGLAIQTKSDLILRDLELLKSINRKAKCVVQITLTTYDEDLCKIIDPCMYHKTQVRGTENNERLRYPDYCMARSHTAVYQ
jgi:DNA repair photolyase